MHHAAEGVEAARQHLLVIELAYFCWAANEFFRVSWWGAGWRTLVGKVALALITVLVGILGALFVVVLPAFLSGRLTAASG